MGITKLRDFSKRTMDIAGLHVGGYGQHICSLDALTRPAPPTEPHCLSISPRVTLS